jgi:uncharacterized protein YndB with AHSA1/START domain
MARRELVSAHVSAPPARVFSLVSDPSRLPEWNSAITEVVEAPPRLAVGSSWKIRLHALGQTWVSESRVTTLDPTTGTFSYRSRTDDGNPSYADWEWQVEPDGDGAQVTVGVELHPTTFWRKHLLVRIRQPALRKEMVGSLRALESAVIGAA